MKRFRVHMHVEDLDKNIAFYSTMFALQPARSESDYAKWMLQDPPVNFAIYTRGATTGIATAREFPAIPRAREPGPAAEWKPHAQ